MIIVVAKTGIIGWRFLTKYQVFVGTREKKKKKKKEVTIPSRLVFLLPFGGSLPSQAKDIPQRQR